MKFLHLNFFLLSLFISSFNAFSQFKSRKIVTIHDRPNFSGVLLEQTVDNSSRKVDLGKQRFFQFHEGSSKIPISDKYSMGLYLIYDCFDYHFACVDPQSFRQCRYLRDLSLLKNSAYFPCAPLKRIESMDQCFVTQAQMILNASHSNLKKLCEN